MTSKLNRTIDQMYKKSEKEIENIFNPSDEKPAVSSEDISVVKSHASIFTRAAKGVGSFYRQHTVDFKYLLLIIPILAIFFVVKEVARQQSLRSQAAIHQASLYFQVPSWTLPPESSFNLWIDTDSQTSFVDAEITFDPNIIRLTGDITTNSSLGRIIRVTSMNDANSTGKISIILGLDPSQSTPPSGTFQIASLPLGTKTASSLSTIVGFDTESSQLVAADQSEFSVSATGLTLNLNPTPTPTPTATPTIAPSPTPTVYPTPTSGSLTVSNVQTTSITQTSAVISWNLSNYGTGQVEYGTSTNYGSLSAAETSYNWNYHVQTLTGLTSNTLYHYRVISTDQSGQTIKSPDYIFTTLASGATPTPTPTLTPTPTPTAIPGSLIISDVQATSITQTSAVISWSLSDYGTGQVEYGTTTAYGSLSKAESTFKWKYHIQTIKNLAPNTLYHYRVFSTSESGIKSTSGDYTLTTLASEATPTAAPVANLKLSGIVTDSLTSAPLKSASVKLRSASAKWWQGSTTVKTDANGHYGVYLPMDNYKVSVSKFGYKTIYEDLVMRTDTILNFQLVHR